MYDRGDQPRSPGLLRPIKKRLKDQIGSNLVPRSPMTSVRQSEIWVRDEAGSSAHFQMYGGRRCVKRRGARSPFFGPHPPRPMPTHLIHLVKPR